MASAYGALKLLVLPDVSKVGPAVRSAAQSAGDDAGKAVSGGMSKGLTALKPIAASIGRGVATGLGVASTAAIGFGVASFRAAARVGEMNATLKALAQANNLSYPQMLKQVSAVRSYGIQAGVAQNLVAQFARNQLDLGKSTDLARVAQDAAVISGRDSSEVLDQLIHGITTQNSLVLRNAGINVQAGQAMADYAKSVGKSASELTATERAQAVLNATLAAGKPIAGAYAAAMTEPGKVLRSFPRIIDDIKIAVGTGLVNAFGPVILQAYDLGKALARALEPGGKLAPIFDAIGVAAARLAAPIAGAAKHAATFIETLDPAKINTAVDAIKRFGPAAAVAGAGLAVFSGTKVLGSLPILGPMLQSLLSPLGLVGKGLLSIGQAGAAALPGLGGLAPAAGSLGAALGPVGLAIAGVVAAIGLLMAVSPEFRAAMISLGGALLGVLKAAFAGVMNAIKPLVPVVVLLARELGSVLAPAVKELGPVLSAVSPLLTALFAILGGLVKVVALLLVPLIKLAAAILRLQVTYITVPGFKALAAILGVVANAIATVVRWILGGSPGLIPALSAMGGAVSGALGVLRALGAAFTAVAGAVRAAWSAVTGATKAAVSAVIGSVRSMASGVTGAAQQAASGLVGALSSGLSRARSVVSSAVSGMVGAARGLVGGFASAGASAASAMASSIQAGLSGIASMVSSTIGGAISAAKRAVGRSVIGEDVGGEVAAGLARGLAAGAPVVSAVLGALLGGAGGGGGHVAVPGGGPAVGALAGGGGGPEGGRGGLGATLAAALPRLLSPLAGAAEGLGGISARATITINVYPQPGQSETEIAAAVSRRLGWAVATGRAS